MVKKLFLFFTLILCQQFSFAADDYRQIKNEILRLINEHRSQIGLATLKENIDIDKVANEHSKNMATHKIIFGHDGFDERMNVISAKINAVTAMAENVLYGDVDAGKAVKLWLNSKGHKKNIEGNYNLTGIGIVMGENDNLYFTMIFIRNQHSDKQ